MARGSVLNLWTVGGQLRDDFDGDKAVILKRVDTLVSY